ncbi:FecR family protein [Chitinophaga eiseniae]|uniref:DUF4974 domain-containing protein n=1 Tax=Chitinophaga eiseniae TaxID=634771 RepID=A0A847SRR7_9BACT|nr:FecR domain-containing protein [Chitinophaga eiseniae]NLR80206.1 DUF4974 domain-containing protein [Chitinophaga eiseniae]
MSLKLLRRFLRGKTSDREDAVIDKWYHSIDDTAPLDLWNEQGKKEAIKSSLQAYVLAHVNRTTRRGIVEIRWMAAASITVLLLAGLWLVRHQQRPPVYYTIAAPHGTVKQVLLPDSSIVWLKPGTTVRYSANYGVKDRELELLNGEACFEVQKNTTYPFVVNTDQLQTKVLGTVFTVRSYAQNQEVQVWVEQGRVQVSDKDKVLQELTQHMRLQWNRTNHRFVSDSLYWRQALAWRKGVLLLESASFAELADELQEIYGVTLTSDNQHILQQRYDAKFFIRTPVEDIIKALIEVHHIRYKKEANNIIFY